MKWTRLDLLIPEIAIDLRYGTPNNFTGNKMYTRAFPYLRTEVAGRLAMVHAWIHSEGLSFKIFDAYRPRSVQWMLWSSKPDENFIAHPQKGSKHSRGAAVDLTLIDIETRRELPMPTPFDDFSEKSGRNYMDLPQEQITNRERLEQAMITQGFIPDPNEWWHFNDGRWNEFELSDLSFDALEGARLFSEEKFWEAHEAWEREWKEGSAGEQKDAIQFLIQVAGCLHHRQSGRVDPARTLAQRALKIRARHSELVIEGVDDLLERISDGLSVDLEESARRFKAR